jgi:hypothetical protein
MKTILLVILSVILLTSCGKNSNNLESIVTEAINNENYFMVSNDLQDTISLVSVDSSFTVKDYAYFNHTEKDTSKIIVKGHKDALVILTTVKQYEGGYYTKRTAMIVYDEVNKTSCFFAITSDKNQIKKTIKDMYKSDKVRLQEFKENTQSFYDNEVQ